MKTKVLIAHAKGEEELAEQLAVPIREAGYEVTHEGTLLVGQSVVREATKLLGEGSPLVICGTEKAMGSRWTKKLAQAARVASGTRLFAVQMEEDADVEAISLDEVIACYWKNPTKAEQDLVSALHKYYPPERDPQQNLRIHDLESRYRELALKACDIIDLVNLPEDDRHLASRELELRRLYVGLRMRLEIQANDEVDDKALEALEKRRTLAWGDGGQRDDYEENRVSLGERLQAARRLVVLGDPGAGKSTLLRWLATAYLLRLRNDPDWDDLPDRTSLPDTGWLPILIRCRDLPPHTDNLDGMLYHSLRKSELAAAECKELRNLLRDKLKAGTALLLVDGLDEITEPAARTRFSQQLERIHNAFPGAPIVVTSRIVGYREMGYRIRAGFEHLTVADLSRQDKDDFARRWSALTERAERREAAAEELIRDIHSSDRIERLTGNPMLLTTMALIKRKIGRLPQRRVDLYQKAVEVLLNWRSEVDAPLDPREALPQLEYLAHAMCADGIQQVREDQVLELLHQVREDYPHIHPLVQHTPEEFLYLLERRTGLLIQSGHTRHKGHSVPVYEFRHLTFQEYLAGIALVQGHYRERDKDKNLAQSIAPLAGQVEQMEGNKFGRFGQEDSAVVENWREALRLCLAACNDDDVDATLLAILQPLSNETGTARARAVLAALCLADEPNVSEAVARRVLQVLAAQVENDDGMGGGSTLDAAAMELAVSRRWVGILGEFLLDEFFRRDSAHRAVVGGLYSMMRERQVPLEDPEFSIWLAEQAAQLPICTEREAAAIALTVMTLAFRGKNCQVQGMADGLIHRLSDSAPSNHAAAWALMWMNGGFSRQNQDEQWNPDVEQWHPDVEQLERLLATVMNLDCESETLRFLSIIFKRERTTKALDALLLHLPGSPVKARQAIVEALGAINAPRATDTLLKRLKDAQEDQDVRLTAAMALGSIKDPCVTDALLERLQDTQEDQNMRRAAATALGSIKDPRAIDALLERLQDAQEDRSVRRAAATALGSMKDPRAIDALLERLQDTQEKLEVRRAAATALGPMKDPRAIDALLERLQDAQEDQHVRHAAATALGRGAGAREITILLADLRNKDEFLRRIVLGALAWTCEETDRQLLSVDLDGLTPWLDPQLPLTSGRIVQAADILEKPLEEIQQRYAVLAERFGLKLA